MSLFNAFNSNNSRTANGAVTHSTSNSSCMDLFFLVGASRGTDISNLVYKAYSEDKELATRIMLWSRDIRQGAGERQHIKDFINFLENVSDYDTAIKVLAKLPELGRWDDLFCVQTKFLQTYVINLVKEALKTNNGLCAKWMPRESGAKKLTAKWLREGLGLSPRAYRKLIVSKTKVIETNLCNKDYTFEYAHVPSKAHSCYTKCFYRNDEERYTKYKRDLVDGKTKINAGAVYPSDVLLLSKRDDTVATAMWKSLPNYMESSSKKILPVADVSGSMGNFGFSGTLQAIHNSVSLALYIAQHNTGPLSNLVMTFCGQPSLYKVSELGKMASLKQEANNLINTALDMNTDLEAVFTKLLELLKKGKVTPKDVPDTLLIFSDMHFDFVGKRTVHEKVERKFKEAGYKLPQVVFWNLDGTSNNIPVKQNKDGVALVSGYSPSLMKSILKGVTTPYEVMLNTVMTPRYDI